MKRPLKRLLRRLAILVAVYLAAEAVSAAAYGWFIDAPTQEAIRDIRGPYGQVLGPAGLVPHPYSLSQLRPDYVDAAGIRQTNRLGWRGREFAQEKPPGVLRVVCVGGSTTYGIGAVRPDDAWPVQLEASLNRPRPPLDTRHSTLDTRFEVLNCGIPRASSAEIFGTVAFRVIHLKPDLIVLSVGLEDVNALLAPDYRPDYTHWRQSWIAPAYGRTTRRLLASPLYRLLFIAFTLPAASDFDFQYRPDPSWDNPVVGQVPHRDPVGFRRNVENTLIITRGRGIPVLLVGEPADRPYPQVQWTLDAQRAILRDLSTTYGAPLCAFNDGETVDPGRVAQAIRDSRLLSPLATRPSARYNRQ